MSKNLNIAVLLLGILLFLGSCAPFAVIIYQETLTEPVDSYSLSTGYASERVSFQTQAGVLSRFSVETNITSSSVQEDPDSFDDSYLARFVFPVRYTVSDSSGNTLLSKNTSLDWKDDFSTSTSNEETSSTGGSLTAKINLEKFTSPADGAIDINIEISPDNTYEATLDSAKLHLQEDLIDYTGYIIAGVAMLILGFVISVISFILLIINSAKASSEEGEGNEAVSNDQKVNQDAMIIQLSALSGYIIPLGSLIVPVILWQVWKDKDSYIDEMGREAVNFELSMLVYYMISLVLCLILIGLLLIFAVAIFHLAYIIIAAIHTSRGAHFRYPLTIRFIK